MSPEILKKYAEAIEEEEKFNKALSGDSVYGTIYHSNSDISLKAGEFKLQFRNKNKSAITSEYIPNIINSFTSEEIEKITNTIISIIDKKFKDVLEVRENSYQLMLLEKIKRR